MKITRPGTTAASAAALFAAVLTGFTAAPASAQGNPAQEKTAACIGCHEIPGYKASFPSVYSVPKLYGQTAKYIEGALVAYRKGDRSHPTMRAIAAGLSDKDIAELAAYYGTK